MGREALTRAQQQAYIRFAEPSNDAEPHAS